MSEFSFNFPLLLAFCYSSCNLSFFVSLVENLYSTSFILVDLHLLHYLKKNESSLDDFDI